MMNLSKIIGISGTISNLIEIILMLIKYMISETNYLI